MPERPRILLLPGLLCDAGLFAAQVAALEPHADVAVADFSHAQSIGEMADRALATVAGKFHLVGYSMGGRVALEIVRRAPGRVERMCLMDTGFAPMREAEVSGRMELVELAHRAGMAALAVSWLPAMLHPARATDAALLATLTQMVCRATPVQHERQIRALLGRPDATPVLPAIRCPTLLLVGRQDRWATVAQHEAMAAAIPGARLEVIEESGHFSPAERPEAVSAALLHFFGFDARMRPTG
ncbi:MAG: alpha/beta fold hydrolase [Proteobacteria bacterium]|nr:alpha/beta fold hydrolase [Pseudomonadota bacterium]